jgi:hypothetical protein
LTTIAQEVKEVPDFIELQLVRRLGGLHVFQISFPLTRPYHLVELPGTTPCNFLRRHKKHRRSGSGKRRTEKAKSSV